MLLFLLLSGAVPLTAQVDFLDYHTAMYEVQESLMDEDFERARVVLAGLLEAYESPFVKDWVIAAQLAAMTGRSDQAFQFLKQAFIKGFSPACARKIPILDQFLSTTLGDTLIQAFPSFYKSYLASIDVQVWQEFHARYLREQAAKQQPHYAQIVQSNFDFMLEYWAEKGFPGTEVVGLDTSRWAEQIEDCGCSNQKVMVTLLHQPYPIARVGLPAYEAAIRAGRLHPDDFARVYTFERNRISVLYRTAETPNEAVPDFFFLFPFGRKTADLQRVSQDRARFGISLLEFDRKKTTLEQKNGLRLY